MKKLFQSISVLVGFLVMTISSCKTGRNYQRPTVLLPEQFNQESLGPDTTSIADINWREYYGSGFAAIDRQWDLPQF